MLARRFCHALAAALEVEHPLVRTRCGLRGLEVVASLRCREGRSTLDVQGRCVQLKRSCSPQRNRRRTCEPSKHRAVGSDSMNSSAAVVALAQTTTDQPAAATKRTKSPAVSICNRHDPPQHAVIPFHVPRRDTARACNEYTNWAPARMALRANQGWAGDGSLLTCQVAPYTTTPLPP